MKAPDILKLKMIYELVNILTKEKQKRFDSFRTPEYLHGTENYLQHNRNTRATQLVKLKGKARNWNGAQLIFSLLWNEFFGNCKAFINESPLCCYRHQSACQLVWCQYTALMSAFMLWWLLTPCTLHRIFLFD